MGTNWFTQEPNLAACRGCGYPTLKVTYCAVCAQDMAAANVFPDSAPTSSGLTPAA
jgi:hypothetical protein